MKDWLIQVVVKKFGPSALRAGVVALLTAITAYSGVLEQWGVIVDKVARTITIHFDTMEVVVLGLVMAMLGGTVKVAQATGKEMLPKKEDEPVEPPKQS